MKTLNTLITLSILITSSVSFAGEDESRSLKKSNVPVAPSVWEGADIVVPEGLSFLKARSAFVPIADFVWGEPAEAPANLTMIPAAPFIYGNNDRSVPAAPAFMKAKSGFVSVAPFVFGDPIADIPAGLSVK